MESQIEDLANRFWEDVYLEFSKEEIQTAKEDFEGSLLVNIAGGRNIKRGMFVTMFKKLWGNKGSVIFSEVEENVMEETVSENRSFCEKMKSPENNGKTLVDRSNSQEGMNLEDSIDTNFNDSLGEDILFQEVTDSHTNAINRLPKAENDRSNISSTILIGPVSSPVRISYFDPP